jgi:hypothetical protein
MLVFDRGVLIMSVSGCGKSFVLVLDCGKFSLLADGKSFCAGDDKDIEFLDSLIQSVESGEELLPDFLIARFCARFNRLFGRGDNNGDVIAHDTSKKDAQRPTKNAQRQNVRRCAYFVCLIIAHGYNKRKLTSQG